MRRRATVFRRGVPLLALSLLVVGPVSAQPSPFPAVGPISLDGHLDDGEWADAWASDGPGDGRILMGSRGDTVVLGIRGGGWGTNGPGYFLGGGRRGGPPSRGVPLLGALPPGRHRPAGASRWCHTGLRSRPDPHHSSPPRRGGGEQVLAAGGQGLQSEPAAAPEMVETYHPVLVGHLDALLRDPERETDCCHLLGIVQPHDGLVLLHDPVHDDTHPSCGECGPLWHRSNPPYRTVRSS